MFKKASYIFIFLSLFSFMILFSTPYLYSFSFKNFDLSSYLIHNFNFNFLFDFQVFLYFFMVGSVTSVVCLYSEYYMKMYNVKKFFYLMIFFFATMVILSVSGSFLLFILGWDGLGVTSIGLIMFYPNKIGMFNSILTMAFNRLGDGLAMMAMGLIILFSSPSFYFFCYDDAWLILFFLMLCSFTKSAQFPVSSWLPAAMSAPTPISAMVHSSTLVTAGIFLVSLFSPLFSSAGVFTLIFLYGILSFLMGGFMACLESDFKKLVAFSTMSQVSLVIVLLLSFSLFVSFSHMVFHAFFKTLLFCCVGVFFSVVFGDQIKVQSSSDSNFICFFLFLSVFSMLGLMFSSSFFSKDLALEICISEANYLFFLLMILGSVFTIFYCGKIFYSLNLSFLNSSSLVSNKFHFTFLYVFSFLCLYLGNIFFDGLEVSEPCVNISSFFFILFILLAFNLISHKSFVVPFFTKFFLDVGFMKSSIFDRFTDRVSFSSLTFSSSFNDRIFMKPNSLIMSYSTYSSNSAFFNSFSLLLLVLLFLF